jgi:hypothetical protein
VAHRAQVVFTGGQLAISADNSSLNQILRDVSRQTGMKITGGVADQRVFGRYGPGAPAGILASLLDGTGSNMLLRESATHTPLELILTPRGGGVTPPSPNATGGDDDTAASEAVPAQQSAAPNPQSQTPPQPPAPQTAPSSGFFGAPGAVPATVPATGVGSGPGTTAQTTGGSNPQSPNGVLTPQQILEQLQQLQSQPSTK